MVCNCARKFNDNLLRDYVQCVNDIMHVCKKDLWQCQIYYTLWMEVPRF